MRKIRRLLDLLPMMLMWLVLSVFLWGFVFNFLTDAAPENKIVLFADAAVPDATGLAVQLEATVTAPVEMVQVRPFSYAMMGSEAIGSADLYIVSASQAETYRDWFSPLPEALLDAGPLLEMDGIPFGVRVYNAAAGTGVASSFITYMQPGAAAEDYYLFVGSSSLHVQNHENAVDDQAVTCALHLLEMP